MKTGQTKPAKDRKSISWRMKMPRGLHAQIKSIAEHEGREINNTVNWLLAKAVLAEIQRGK